MLLEAHVTNNHRGTRPKVEEWLFMLVKAVRQDRQTETDGGERGGQTETERERERKRERERGDSREKRRKSNRKEKTYSEA